MKDLQTNGFKGTLDNGNYIFGAHSAGNHAFRATHGNFSTLQFNSMVMIDPVDGEDPNGIIKQYVIHPPAKVNFNIPALHIMTGKDPQEKAILRACVHVKQSDFTTRNGPIYQINATDFGHMGVVDDGKGTLLVWPSPKKASRKTHFITFSHTILYISLFFNTNRLIFFPRRVPKVACTSLHVLVTRTKLLSMVTEVWLRILSILLSTGYTMVMKILV